MAFPSREPSCDGTYSDNICKVRSSKNLVVVRAGDSSLHPGWMVGPEVANFDLCVSYFGDDPTRYRGADGERHDFKGGKWDGLANFFGYHPELLGRYEYFWLPDDDLACDKSTINRLFARMREHCLDVGQPALTLDSYHSYLGYIRSRSFSLRYSDTIEVMAPCLRAEVLRAILPIAATVPSGWGLDAIWTRLNANNHCKSAIIDDCLINHTRPVGGPIYSAMTKIGRSPGADAEFLSRQFGQTRLYPLIYAAIDANGKVWRSKLLIAMKLWFDLRLQSSSILHLKSKRSINQLLRRQLFKKVSLDQVQPSILA